MVCRNVAPDICKFVSICPFVKQLGTDHDYKVLNCLFQNS